ncbi:MAG: hypothetical protein JXJ22_16410 [Bacteroidales bacterium]|nr:hypothetical protein [Bacteroidales bacterium]
MNTFRKAIICISLLVFIALIFIAIKFFIKFNGGFSDNPEHWFAAGSLIISFMTVLVTVLIAIYVYELNKKTSKFSDQKQLFLEISSLVNNLHFEMMTNYSHKEYITKLEDAERKLNEYQSLGFIFNNEEIVIKKIVAYRKGLEKIKIDASHELFQKINTKTFTEEKFQEYANKSMVEVSNKTYNNATSIIKPLLTDLINSLKEAMK